MYVRQINLFTALLAIILILPGSLPLYSASENLEFQNLGLNQGLSHSTVTAILRDRRGFAWIGTARGLNLYNGYEFHVFQPKQGDKTAISGFDIISLLEDRDGLIWVGTSINGLSCYDPETGHFTSFHPHPDNPHNPNSLPKGAIARLLEDRDGGIWIVTPDAIAIRDKKKQTFSRFSFQGLEPYIGLKPPKVQILFLDSANRFWLALFDIGLISWPAGKTRYTFYSHHENNPRSLSSNDIRCIAEDRSGRIWIGSARGLNRLEPESGQITQFLTNPNKPGSLSYETVNAILPDHSGGVWVGTLQGLNYWDRQTETFFNYSNKPADPASLPSNFITCLHRCVQDIIWIGSRGGGLALLDKDRKKFQLHRAGTDTRTAINNNLIATIWDDGRGALWIGTWGGGLNKYNREKKTNTVYKPIPGHANSLSHPTISAFAPGYRNDLWIATWGGGLNRFFPETGKFLRYFTTPSPHDPADLREIEALLTTPDLYVWIGNKFGLTRLNSETGVSRLFVPFPSANKTSGKNDIISLYRTQDNAIWVGTNSNGLFRFNPETGAFTHFLHHPGETSGPGGNTIKCMFEDSAGEFWVGAENGGLNLFSRNKNRWTILTDKDGLPDNSIFSILEDNKQHLWLSTNKGISRFNKLRGVFRNYSIKDGLQGDEFNRKAFYRNPATGEMFFGGNNGFNSFFPERIRDNMFAPPAAITSIMNLDHSPPSGKTPWATRSITLKQGEAFISFEFSALNFRNPEQNTYAYMLEGLEKDWRESGVRRYAAYTDLNPGSYTFRVRAANDDGLWSREGPEVQITVIPYFWNTWWFRALMVLSVILFLFLLNQWRINQVKRQKKILETLVEERTLQLQERQKELETARETAIMERQAAEKANKSKGDFLARMSHEIRTPMNAIIGFTDMLMDTDLSDEQKDYSFTIQRSSQALLSLLNDILDSSRIESGRLSMEAIDFDPEVTLFDVCELMRPRIGLQTVEIICRIGDRTPAYVKGDPGRFRQVLVNLMSNAVKFTRNGEIEISIDVEEETEKNLHLHVTVRDTGIGIPSDRLESIFEPFQQADGSTTRKYGGTGLGLTISKQLAQIMGGDVWADSRIGEGSTFHFTAVLLKSSKHVVKLRPPAKLSGKRALIMDDNPINLEILAHILNSAGMDVLPVSQSKAALPAIREAFLQNRPVDLCILDIRMPDISGYEVAETIRKENAPISQIPLLAFSSSTDKRAATFLEFGFKGFLPKPINRSRLLQMVERLIAGEEDIPSPNTEETLVTRHSLYEEAKHSVRILLAEDNPINRKLALFLLERAGYHVVAANNGREAVEKYLAAPQDFDLIFMDIMMPEMDGLTATHAIREAGFHDIPIIAVTAQTMKGDREKFIKAGMDDYISKPIKRETVFEIVKKWALNKR